MQKMTRKFCNYKKKSSHLVITNLQFYKYEYEETHVYFYYSIQIIERTLFIVFEVSNNKLGYHFCIINPSSQSIHIYNVFF